MGVNSQVIYYEKEISVTTVSKLVKIDSLSIIPASLKVYDENKLNLIDDSLYVVDFYNSTIMFSEELISTNEKLIIVYRTFPFDLSLSYASKDTLTLLRPKDSLQLKDYFIYPIDNKANNKFDGLISTGNISRGITVGNNQSASVQSNLDIRLSGNLTEDIEIQAVITDNSIPIQADGNTYQLQEFDKVFIRLKKDNTILTAGDYEVFSPKGYFLPYSKKSQGGMLNHSWKSLNSKSDTIKQSMHFSYGIAKGKFAKNSFKGMEGNQGPYRLKGNNNEIYVVVLSGTERVFLDEQLMTRGYDNDYVIDYNLAEIRFTNKRIISSESRIVVEFEYSDKNFARTLITGSYIYTTSKSEFWINLFAEQDMRNQPLHQDLSEEDKRILSLAGDNPEQWLVNSVDSLSFSSDFVMYALVDTLGYDSVLVYSTDADKAHYRASFSYVGLGNGNYIHSKSIANGRVFEWVQPINSIPQGDYEPVMVLIPPRKQRQVAAGLKQKINKNLEFGFEVSVSDNDINTFSDVDNNDNIGAAAKIYLQHLNEIDLKGKKYNFRKLISYEFDEANFNAVERFRSVDFERNWNIENISLLKNKHIFSALLGLEMKNIKLIDFQSDYIYLPSMMKGSKNNLNVNLNNEKFSIKHNTMFMSSDMSTYSTNFLRNKGTILYKTNFLNPGIAFDNEYNVFSILVDSLMPNSYSFAEFEPFVVNSNNSKLNYKLYHKYRINNAVANNALKHSYTANESGFSIGNKEEKKNRFSVLFALRETEVKDSSLTKLMNDRQIISRFDNSLNLFKGSILSTTFYETGSGLEAKKSFTYIEVLPGQGLYTWTDYNNNGIKELDEFEPAVYQQEANYIKILLPVNEFVRVNTIRFSETLIIEPQRYFRESEKKYAKVISNFSNRLNFSIDNKTESAEIIDRFLPFSGTLRDDSLLINSSSIIRNVFSFRRGHPIFSAWHTFSDNYVNSLMINGKDSRRNVRHEYRMIWNFSKSTGLEGLVSHGSKQNISDYLISRNYFIKFYELDQGIHYQPTNNTRITLKFRFKQSDNSLGSLEESAKILSLGPEIRLPIKSKQNLNIRFLYHNIKYNSTINTPLAFEMLESLNPGNNFTWNINLQASLSSNLQLNFIYEGRKSDNQKIRNFGSLQLRALL